QQRLAEGVVELVRAGVAEVLTLQVDARPSEVLGQPLRRVQRRRPADEGVLLRLELELELGVGPGLAPGSLQLLEGGHQGLGHVLPAVGPEPAFHTISSRSLAAGSAARIRASPTRIASAPARRIRAASTA